LSAIAAPPGGTVPRTIKVPGLVNGTLNATDTVNLDNLAADITSHWAPVLATVLEPRGVPQEGDQPDQ
jgi:hypothetical protein